MNQPEAACGNIKKILNGVWNILQIKLDNIKKEAYDLKIRQQAQGRDFSI